MPLGKVWTPLSAPTMSYIVQLLFFYKGGVDIKYPSKVDMSLKTKKKNQI